MKKLATILLLVLVPFLTKAQTDSAKLLQQTMKIAEEARTYAFKLDLFDSAYKLLNKYEKYDTVTNEYKLIRLYLCAYHFETYMNVIKGNYTDSEYMASLSAADKVKFKNDLQALRWYCTSFPKLKSNNETTQLSYDAIWTLKIQTLDRINELLKL